MKGFKKFGWFMTGVLATIPLLILVAYGAVKLLKVSRSEEPPVDVKVSYPWGAIDLDEVQIDPDSDFEVTLAESFVNEDYEVFDPDHDGISTYNLLALSGGGSNGAFGSGLLCGWSTAGTRPCFKVVTGVSTGALQSTAAFLGPKYDYMLREIYTEYDTQDIYRRKLPLLILARDSVNDIWPLKRLIDKYITEEVIVAVIAEYNAGRRLFVGTTNMDTREFVIWDMGKIAASGKDGALDLYRKVLLASASIPVLFPPVYFEVEADGKKYQEMHSDGGAFAQAFFRGFLLDFEDAAQEKGLLPLKAEVNLYIIKNSKSQMSHDRVNISPVISSIMATTINNFVEISFTASLYRMYVLTNKYGIDFNLADIPNESGLVMSPLKFEPEDMQQLFDYGYQLAEKGYKWEKAPPGLDTDEVN